MFLPLLQTGNVHVASQEPTSHLQRHSHDGQNPSFLGCWDPIAQLSLCSTKPFSSMKYHSPYPNGCAVMSETWNNYLIKKKKILVLIRQDADDTQHTAKVR